MVALWLETFLLTCGISFGEGPNDGEEVAPVGLV